MFSLTDMRSNPRFEEFRQATITAGSDHPSFFGGEKQGGYYVQQNPDEFAALLSLLSERRRPDIYGEIGTAAGGTLRMLHENIGFKRAVVIDDGQHPRHTHFIDNIRSFYEKVMITVADSHSEYAAKSLESTMKAKCFDAVFIDGDHSYTGVLKDMQLVLPYCDECTLMIFHDTVACDGVKKAWDLVENKLAEFVSTDKPFGIGVAYV